MKLLSGRKLGCTALFLFQFVVEDQKFALFNFVNDQNTEADALKEQSSQVGICFLPSFVLAILPFCGFN